MSEVNKSLRVLQPSIRSGGLEMNRFRLPFGEFIFKERYILGEADPDQHIQHEQLEELIALAARRYDGPFGYVGNRLHVVSIDPSIYQRVRMVTNFKAYAVVVHHPTTLEVLQVEKMFMKGFQFASFFSIEEAEAWMDETILRVIREQSGERD